MGMFPDRNGPHQCGRSLIASSTVSIVRLSIRICDLRRISIRPAKGENRDGGLKSRGIFLSRPEARSKPVRPRTPHSLHHQAIPGFLFPIK